MMAVYKDNEEEYDLKCYEKALDEHKKNPKTYTLEEVKKELNLCKNIQ